jgi:hypothetical protein
MLSGKAVGYVEISQIWPYPSSRLSQRLVAPKRRQLCIGARIGLSCGNIGFKDIGTWPHALEAGPKSGAIADGPKNNVKPIRNRAVSAGEGLLGWNQ